MLLDQNSELKLRATRPKPLIVSILAHFVLLLILAISPEWFQTEHRRVIRIAGEDFDLSKLQLRQLTLPPRMPQQRAVPAPVPPPAQPPLVQQPPPQQAAPPPPPPPPPPPRPQPQPMPDRVIRPDDVLAEGARPDGSPRASRGDTREQTRAGTNSPQGGQQALEEAQEAQKAQEAQRGQDGRQAQQVASNAPNRTLPNLNPEALHAPSSLMSSAGKIVEAQLAASARTGGRTGLSRGDNNGTFSTEPQILSPNPKGIDFGPYLNQLIDRLRRNWYYVMPEIARLGQRGRVDVVFTVTKTGMVKDLQVVANSGSEPLDKGALSAIQLSNPFQQLPAEYETDLKLRIAFLYNLHP